jgi:hypothetical protein
MSNMKHVFNVFQAPLRFVFVVVFIAWLSPAVNAARTKALIPLYVDLENNVKAWDPLFKAYFSLGRDFVHEY